jgi:hypothetical protein
VQSSPKPDPVQPPQFCTSLLGLEQVEEQHWPPSQALPHLPQLFWSLEVSSQLPAQQAGTMRPSWVQSCPSAELQPPQLLTLVWVLVQTPSHCTWPASPLQPLPHLPAEQTCGLGQAVPHLPQFRLSVWVLVQLPLQLVWPEGQVAVVPPSFPLLPFLQAPLLHVEPVGQALPHLPQFAALLEVFTQVPEQLTSGLVQVRAQAPPLHAWPLVQALPQLPQSSVLVWVSTHLPEQRTSGLVQVTAQAPLLHAWPLGQAWAQLPQSWLLVWRFTQAPEQAVSPPVQLVPHFPPEQVWPVAQAVPQAPQLVLLVEVSTQAEPHSA